MWATEGADGAPTDVLGRVIDAALHATGGNGSSPAPHANLRVNLDRTGNGRGFGDLVEVATRAQRLLARARPLDGADLQPTAVERPVLRSP